MISKFSSAFLPITYSTSICNLIVANGGGFPKPGETYGAQWQYDTLCKKLVAAGIPLKDAEEIIKGLWTYMLPKYTNFTPALLKQLEFAGVKVPTSMLPQLQSLIA